MQVYRNLGIIILKTESFICLYGPFTFYSERIPEYKEGPSSLSYCLGFRYARLCKCKLHLWPVESWTEHTMCGASVSNVPVSVATLSLHMGSGVLKASLPHFQDENVGEKELYNSALNITCHKQHAVFNIQNKTSLSHSRRPFWQKPSHSCQEYRVRLRTNFKMNLKSICHQIFMPLPDYLWHFNYKHPRRGVLQILTLGSYNKLYWQPLSACSTHPE